MMDGPAHVSVFHGAERRPASDASCPPARSVSRQAVDAVSGSVRPSVPKHRRPAVRGSRRRVRGHARVACARRRPLRIRLERERELHSPSRSRRSAAMLPFPNASIVSPARAILSPRQMRAAGLGSAYVRAMAGAVFIHTRIPPSSHTHIRSTKGQPTAAAGWVRSAEQPEHSASAFPPSIAPAAPARGGGGGDKRHAASRGGAEKPCTSASASGASSWGPGTSGVIWPCTHSSPASQICIGTSENRYVTTAGVCFSFPSSLRMCVRACMYQYSGHGCTRIPAAA